MKNFLLSINLKTENFSQNSIHSKIQIKAIRLDTDHRLYDKDAERSSLNKKEKIHENSIQTPCRL